MTAQEGDPHAAVRATPVGNPAQQGGIVARWQLRRWLVSFRSGAAWYAVGEYVAPDGAGAIARAVEIFGPGEGHRAEEVPWDAAPLPRLSSRAGRSRS